MINSVSMSKIRKKKDLQRRWILTEELETARAAGGGGRGGIKKGT